MRSIEKVFVRKYAPHDSSHHCERADGTMIMVDFFVAGGLPNETKESIIGKTIEFDGHDYCLIADSIISIENTPNRGAND